MTPFVLAHLSDLHLAPLPTPRLLELAGKRALGFVNWRRNRHAIHRVEVVAQIVKDIKAHAPDHIAVTGDLVNIALPGEFPPARVWLEGLGDPGDVTLVPGNHDAYVRRTADHSEIHWGAYMRGDAAPGSAPASGFPFVRRRGPVALIGLSSAVPSLPLMAIGRLGSEQLRRLAEALHRLRDEAFRVVLIHHPPQSKDSDYLKRLVDGPALRAVIAEHGAELLIHGHDHVHSLAWIAAPGTRVPVVGVPSASAAFGRHNPAGYNLYRITGAPGAWQCEAISRGLIDGESVGERGRAVVVGG
jgi:3',5'-cyclic AMP phosphodiesterase CpdA